MSRWKKTLLTAVIEVAVLILAHEVLFSIVAERDVVSTILAAGRHIPASTLILAGTFLLVRFLVLLVLPGIVLVRLALAALEAREGRGAVRTMEPETLPPDREP